MAAPSPRKPRRTRGRHRKPSTFQTSDYARWLRAGVVGGGLAAAIACSQGVASAGTDDSSDSAAPSAGASGVRSADSGNSTKGVTTGPRAGVGTKDESSATPKARAGSAGSGPSAKVSSARTDGDARDENPRASRQQLLPTGSAQRTAAADEPDSVDDAPPTDTDGSAADSVQQPPATQISATPVPDVSSPVEQERAVQRSAPTQAMRTTADEPTASLKTASLTESDPPAAAAAATGGVNAAAAPVPGSDEWLFNNVLTRAVNRLAGWPGTPRNFVDITNYQTDRTLDAANDQLDNIVATAPLGSPARWVPDLLNIFSAFFIPAVPNSTFTDSLNAMGDFLNRVVPPFEIADGAGTLGVITPYKIMGAAVVGTATVLQDMLNGIYDPAQWAIHVIKATTGANATVSDLSDFNSLSAKVVAAQAGALLGGDGGAFDEPGRALNLTLPTWTAAQVNPFTIITYIALVGLYKRFQEMAVLETFTTDTTYDSWNYTISLGSQSTRSQYAAGTFHVTDQDGNGVTWIGVSQGGTYTSEGGALVTINNAQGGFTYTNTLPGAAFFHRSTSEVEADRYDTVYIPVQSANGVRYTLPFKVLIIDGTNANPTGTSTVLNTDAAGVLMGKVTGSDSDGDTMTYSLVGASVNGLSGNSAYTKNGSGNGGIVTINPTTGDITYVSSATAGGSQSFQVRIGDGHYGSTVVTVTVPNTTSITPANLNTSTPYTVTGSVPASVNKPGAFTSFSLGAAPTKGSVTSFNPSTGAFTYTSSVGRIAANDDVVTVIATDANGRSVTLRLAVKPTVVNNLPVVVSTTVDKGSTDPSKWRLETLAGDSRRQTTTGKITATDADGDALSYSLVDPQTKVPVTTTADGGTVTFGPDGSFTYSNTQNKSYFHAAARIGASAAEMNDSFTVAVTDNYTGSVAYTTITMPTYAVNNAPTVSGGTWSHFLVTIATGVKVSDADGDLTSSTKPSNGNQNNGNPWYTFSRSVNTFNWYGSGGIQDFSANGTGDITFTVGDGYYVVSNGVITATAASGSKTD
ncbi:hypothetical protein ACN27E_23675 [Mycobacterium sp. WMMD1722]|uniref:hypothetical protein n=1 Tax=Mycobacterium sp. WMMD1722 TaxID=3404117 RepID=UPI003BF48362